MRSPFSLRAFMCSKEAKRRKRYMDGSWGLRQRAERNTIVLTQMPDAFEALERRARFPTTSWSLIVQAKSGGDDVSREALERLCSGYWYPVFAFLRRKGLEADRARDCTQDFFVALLEKHYLADVERSKGRFRSFLLVAVSHFFFNWLDAEKALKRGGGSQILALDMQEAEGVYRHD